MLEYSDPRRVPVSHRALMQRINRRLARTGRKLVASRTSGARDRFLIVDLALGHAEAWGLDADKVEDLARHLGALADYECVAAQRGL